MKPDKLYISRRNALIPLAEKFANEKCGKESSSKKLKIKDAWSAKWNTAFSTEMERLVNENRLRGQK
ncbi:MAG: hypothetical protein Q7J27_01230 [Syntrophales bacterium]|nr:hypothetical protein [Syntrophales bacterium]